VSAVTGASEVEATRRSQRSDRVVAAGLIAITLVGAMTSSLGAPLIPSIARSTGASLSNAQWTLTITVLVSVAVTPVMGRLTDTRRRRSTIFIALALVTVGGVIAALNTGNLALLLLGRALQGFGQGLAPMMIGIARTVLTGRRQSSTISILSITNAAGVGLGYPLTGLLDRAFGIAGAFWIGGALSSALALIIAALVVPANRTQGEPPVDIIGTALFALSVGALLLALAQGQTWGWSSAAVLVLFAAALVIGGIWVWQQLLSAHPLVELRLLRIRSVLTTDVTVLLSLSAATTWPGCWSLWPSRVSASGSCSRSSRLSSSGTSPRGTPAAR
jgi:MFS family permease